MNCPRCERELRKVFHESNDEMAVESLAGEVILGSCCKSKYNYYCEYCDEFFSL